MRGPILFLIGVLLAACQSRPLFDGSLPHQSIHPELHIGEYATALNAKEILTFSRGPKEPTGLIKVNIETKNLEVLDSNAKEGKDLHLQNSWLYYRINGSLFRRPLVADQKSIIQKISSEVEKLKAVSIVGDYEFLLLKKENAGDFLICRKGDSAEFTAHPLSQQGVSMRASPDGQVILMIETNSGLYLAKASCEKGFIQSQIIEAHAQSNYAKFFQDQDRHWLAYLQEEKGTLQVVEFDAQNLKIKENLKAAGKEFESYSGMDIAFFHDRQKPGILFLNGQTLKLHWTRWQNQSWQESEIPLQGAVGFYNTILKNEKNKLTVSTHAFRAINSQNNYSFEDLVILDLDLR